MWSDARAWGDLVELNRRYFLGEITVSASCNHPLDRETDRILTGLLQLTNYGVLTTSSQPEIYADEPRYISPEQIYEAYSRNGMQRPRHQLAYLREQLQRIQTEFSPEQLKNNDIAVLRTVRAREQEHLDILGTYSGNEIVDSGNPGTRNIVELYERAIELFEEDVASFDKLTSLCWRQDRQRQYVHFLIPTIHPHIHLEDVIRLVKRLKEHKDLVVAFQYEMNGEGPHRQPPADRIQDPAALELLGKFTTTVPLRGGDEPFWWPVTQYREGTSQDSVLSTEWHTSTHLGLDNKKHIQGMLFGQYNKEAYQAGVKADPVAVLVGTKEWVTGIDLLDLIERMLNEEGFLPVF